MVIQVLVDEPAPFLSAQAAEEAMDPPVCRRGAPVAESSELLEKPTLLLEELAFVDDDAIGVGRGVAREGLITEGR